MSKKPKRKPTDQPALNLTDEPIELDHREDYLVDVRSFRFADDSSRYRDLDRDMDEAIKRDGD